MIIGIPNGGVGNLAAFELYQKNELEIKLIPTQMTQKPMLRVGMSTRVQRASQCKSERKMRFACASGGVWLCGRSVGQSAAFGFLFLKKEGACPDVSGAELKNMPPFPFRLVGCLLLVLGVYTFRSAFIRPGISRIPNANRTRTNTIPYDTKANAAG